MQINRFGVCRFESLRNRLFYVFVAKPHQWHQDVTETEHHLSNGILECMLTVILKHFHEKVIHKSFKTLKLAQDLPFTKASLTKCIEFSAFWLK